MRKINYLSDFKLIEEFKDSTLISTVPFEFKYYTKSIKNPYIVSAIKNENDVLAYNNCNLTEDGRLMVKFDKHKLGAGQLKVQRTFELNDKDFTNNTCNYITNETLDIFLDKEAITDQDTHTKVQTYYTVVDIAESEDITRNTEGQLIISDDFKKTMNSKAKEIAEDISAPIKCQTQINERRIETLDIKKQDKIDDIDDIRKKANSALQTIPSYYVTSDILQDRIESTTDYVNSKIANLVDSAPDDLNTLNELATALKDNKDVVELLKQSITTKQDKLESGTNIKTINNQSILGKGNLEIQTDNGVPIVNSIEELDENAEQGSLAVVAIDTVSEVPFSELYQPTSEEVNLETFVIDTTNLSRVSGISVNSSYDTTTEIQNFVVYLFSRDVDMQGGIGQMIALVPTEAITMNCATQEQNKLELFTPNEDGTITVNEESLAIINNLLSSTEFVYSGVMKYGESIDPSYADMFYKSRSVEQKTDLYIKDVEGWEELKTGGGTVEIVDNLTDSSTDKALSANMGRVLNERISAAASGSIDTIAGTLNIRDINAVKNAQAKLGNNESVTYIITDANGNYPSPNNPTVYLDTEEIILDLLYRGNGDALKWLLINKQAYYKAAGTWYSETITDYIKIPALHLRTAQVGDFITLVRHDMPVSEFYSKYIDYNNLNLNLDTTSKTAFDTYLVGIGVKGLFESISDGEAIKRLVEGGYIYTAKDNPRDYPDTIMNPLVGSNNTVTFYTSQITPNTQHMYNGEFWIGNMTGPGIYSYVTSGRPDGSEEGEVYTAYVSPDKTQTLVSMKNPSKAYTRAWNNVESKWLDWNKINFASKNTKYGLGTKVHEMLTTGICAYTPDAIEGIHANWTIFVDCSSDPDSGGYYHLKQTAVCRDGENVGKMWTRLGWYKGEGEDLNFLDWQAVGGGNALGGEGVEGHFGIDVETDKLNVNEDGLKSPIGFFSLVKNLGEENEEWLVDYLSISYVFGFVGFATDYTYNVFKDEESGEWMVEKYPNYSERFATKEELSNKVDKPSRNLLINSNFDDRSEGILNSAPANWSFVGGGSNSSGSVSTEKYNGYKVIDLRSLGLQQNLSLIEGNIYTVSCMYRSQGTAYINYKNGLSDSISNLVNLTTGSQGLQFASSGPLTKASFTFVAKSDAVFSIYANGNLSIACIQLEEGDTVTAYKRAEETYATVGEVESMINESIIQVIHSDL